LRFTAGKSVDDYLADDMLRAAVERRFEIIGEALSRLAKASPELAERIPHFARAKSVPQSPYSWLRCG